MGYTLVKGEFCLTYRTSRHVGSRPDGDSVWFKPDRKSLLRRLGAPPRNADFNGGGFAQLRFEGIDALELHYKGSNHQKEEGCVSARDEMLTSLGFGNINYAPSEDIDSYVRSSVPSKIRGHILTRNIDPFGRPVAFVFPEEAAESDGEDVWLDTTRLRKSINAKLIKAGEAYPAYYTGLPTDLRNYLTNLANISWEHNLGVWSNDSSIAGSRVRRIEDLEDLTIWPKLYRRLFAFFKGQNGPTANFDNWLRANPRERDDQVWIIPESHLGNIHDTVEVSGNTIRMIYWPEELIIVPR